MPNLDTLVKSAQEVVENLNKKLIQIEEIHKDINELKVLSAGLPEEYNKKFHDVVKLSEDYTNVLGTTTNTFVEGNNTMFTSKLSEFAFRIKQLDKEITRLIDTDFYKLFKDLQKTFIDETRKDLEVELKRFQDKINNLQTKVDEIKKQVERLANIDLEKHFVKHQNTLSEIFGAVNGINVTLSNTIQTLTGIVQSLGNIQLVIDTNHKDIKQIVYTFSETTTKHLTEQDKNGKKNNELLESQLKSLIEQNKLLKKGINTNRIIQIVELVFLLVLFYKFLHK